MRKLHNEFNINAYKFQTHKKKYFKKSPLFGILLFICIIVNIALAEISRP